MGKNKTIVISTHLLDEAESVCSRIVMVNHGEIVADGGLAEILSQNNCTSLEEAFFKLTGGEGEKA